MIDAVVVPVGGGGLISGISVAIKQLDSRILVVGAEPAVADDAFRSKAAGSIQGHREDKVGGMIGNHMTFGVSPSRPVCCLLWSGLVWSAGAFRRDGVASYFSLFAATFPNPHPDPAGNASRPPPQAPTTIADGLRTLLGEHTWPQVRDLVDEIILVSEEDCARAMRLVFERLKLVIEGSAGTGVSVAMWSPRLRELLKPAAERRAAVGEGGPRVAVVLCGGNASLDSLPFAKK